MANLSFRRAAAAASTVLLIAAVALLSGCGDDEAGVTSAATTGTEASAETSTASTVTEQFDPSESASSPEPVIEDFLVSSDSAAVCASLSPELLASTYGDLSGCRSGRPPQSLASSIELADQVVVTGDKATAVVVPDGGAYDGADVSFALALDGDRWVITRLKADVPVGP